MAPGSYVPIQHGGFEFLYRYIFVFPYVYIAHYRSFASHPQDRKKG